MWCETSTTHYKLKTVSLVIVFAVSLFLGLLASFFFPSSTLSFLVLSPQRLPDCLGVSFTLSSNIFASVLLDSMVDLMSLLFWILDSCLVSVLGSAF